MRKTLGVVVGEPPKPLQHARLDNIALVPASLLPLKGTYKPLANRLPKGSVLLVANASPRQNRILEKVATFLRTHSHTVITLPIESISQSIKNPPRLQPENLRLAF